MKLTVSPLLPSTINYQPLQIQVNSYQQAIDAWAKHQNEFELAEYYLDQAWKFVPPDNDARAFVKERSAWTKCRILKYAEALECAKRAWQIKRDAPQLATLIECELAVGDLLSARQLGKLALRFPESWGKEATRIKEGISRMSRSNVKIYGEIEPKLLDPKKKIGFYPPIENGPTQKLTKITVNNVLSWKKKLDENGNTYIQVNTDGSKPFQFAFELQIQPYSVLDYIKSGQVSTENVEKYLGKSQGYSSDDLIDPNSKIASVIVRPFTSSDKVQTANNILRWIASNMKFGAEGMKNAEISDRILVARRGHCEHLATATAALLRNAGIPARLVRGWNLDPSKKTALLGQHTVCEYFLDNRWVRTNSERSVIPGLMEAGYISRFHTTVTFDKKSLECILDGFETKNPRHTYEPVYHSDVLSSSID